MEPVQLWGSGTLSKAATVTAQRRVNVYFELRPDGDKVNLAVFGTPGLVSTLTLATAPNGPIRGVHEGENYFYLVAGDTVYRITTDFLSETTYGTLRTTSGEVGMADNGTQLLIVDGNSGYILSGFDTATSTLTEIADPDFIDGCTTTTCIAGRFIVERPTTGQFYISDSYDGTAWDGSNFATAEQHSDTLVAVDDYRGYLVLFGTRTIEGWQNVGALDFPFAPVLNATQMWGLAAKYSRAKLDNCLYFLGQNAQGQVQVMRINGWAVERVSDSDVENAINSYGSKSDAVALSYLLDGHPMYQFTFPGANKSWLFDASTQIWSELASGNTASNRHIGHHAIVVNGKTYVTDYRQSSPKIYELSPTTYSDDGSTVKRIIATRHLVRGGNVFTIDELRLDMETGVGLQTGQGSDPKIMVRISRDGGRTYGSERQVGIGAAGKYRARACVRRCGSAEDFVFEFSMTDPVKFAVERGLWKIRQRPQ